MIEWHSVKLPVAFIRSRIARQQKHAAFGRQSLSHTATELNHPRRHHDFKVQGSCINIYIKIEANLPGKTTLPHAPKSSPEKPTNDLTGRRTDAELGETTWLHPESPALSSTG